MYGPLFYDTRFNTPGHDQFMLRPFLFQLSSSAAVVSFLGIFSLSVAKNYICVCVTCICLLVFYSYNGCYITLISEMVATLH